MSKPRVWLVPYLRDWSFDITALEIARHLGHLYEFRLGYTAEVEAGELERWEADCYVDFWWHGTLHYTFGRRTLKQVSSHRWKQKKWGSLKASNLLRTYADDVGAIAVPSLELMSELMRVDPGDRPGVPPRQIVLAQKGFDPELFSDAGARAGDLTVGWAGAVEATDKHVDDLIAAWPDLRIAGGVGEASIARMTELGRGSALEYGQMPAFYNGLDVVAVASEAEGDPRPLIEGMACGCFPVTTDVGIATELVRHKENGYIVPGVMRGPEAFARAFAWCRDNLELVRAAGAENALSMARTRTWEAVMPSWRRALEAAIDRGADGYGPTRFGEMAAQLAEG